jgi:light-regulated signal transduction histidine kinase (bacteriophytochrome)
LASLLDLDVYLYYRLSEDGTHLQLASLGGVSDAHRLHLERLALGQGISGSVALTSQPRVVEEIQQTQDEATGIIRSIGLRAYASFPLVIHNRLFGTISFGSRRRSRFDPETLDLARAICDLIATAVYRRQDEIRLQQFAEQLENSNRDLQEFAFVASHDLQEPLRKIEAFGAALVETSTNLSEKQVIFIERMRNAASRMRGMVNDLLMLSRVDRSAAPFSHIDLTQVASDSLSTLEIQVRRTGAAIKVDELPKVEADASQMHQLLQNLIGNALKFHRKETPPQVKIYSRLKAPAAVQIFVEDNGIGFPESEAERIFQPFQRLVGRSDYEGSRMGLSICRKIVERHNGSITAHSQLGQGSTFIITLPFRQGNISPGRTE